MTNSEDTAVYKSEPAEQEEEEEEEQRGEWRWSRCNFGIATTGTIIGIVDDGNFKAQSWPLIPGTLEPHQSQEISVTAKYSIVMTSWKVPHIIIADSDTIKDLSEFNGWAQSMDSSYGQISLPDYLMVVQGTPVSYAEATSEGELLHICALDVACQESFRLLRAGLLFTSAHLKRYYEFLDLYQRMLSVEIRNVLIPLNMQDRTLAINNLVNKPQFMIMGTIMRIDGSFDSDLVVWITYRCDGTFSWFSVPLKGDGLEARGIFFTRHFSPFSKATTLPAEVVAYHPFAS